MPSSDEFGDDVDRFGDVLARLRRHDLGAVGVDHTDDENELVTDGGTDQSTDGVRRDDPQRLASTEGYPIYLHNVGGKEPDGKPTRLGKWTFATKMVREVVLDNVSGRVLNACAGKTRLQKRGCEFFRNDIDEDRDADLHVDVREIHHHLESETFDAAVLDPPFDPGRAEKLYEGWHGQEYSNARDAVAELVCPGGIVVELGWNSWSLSDKDGWEPVEHHIYRQSSFKADVHLTVDRKVNQKRLVTDGGREQDTEELPQKELDDVYRDRNLLACALAQATHAPSGWKPAPDAGDDWAIVWIETPMGQVSWHVPRDMAESLAPPQRDSEYDGYDREIKNDRLADWADKGCWC